MHMTCKGDLSQLASQKELLDRGFSYYMVNVYPVVKEESIQDFLYFMYTQSIDGWWHYSKKYTEYGICSEEDFINKLKNVSE